MAAEDPNVEIGMLINNTLTIVKGAGMMVLKLIQYMIALKKQQRLTQAQYDSIIQFARDTEGDFTIANIPTQDPEKIAQFQEALRSGGVAFCNLPDLDVGDGLTQVAIRNKDFARFQYIFEEFSKTQLSGGMKEYVELKNNTSGNLTLHNIPLGSNYGKVASIGETTANLIINHGNDPAVAKYLEKHPSFKDKNRDQIKQMVVDEYLNTEGQPEVIEEMLKVFPLDRSQSPETVTAANQSLRLSEEVRSSSHFMDFRSLIQELEAQKVSYAIMPDLNIKDDYTQIAVANIHESRFKEALKNFLREGAFASEMSMDDYYNTGMMNPEEYTETASEETRKTVEEAKAEVHRGQSKDRDPETTYKEVSHTMEKQSETAKYEYYAAQASDSPDSTLQEIHFGRNEIISYDKQTETAQIWYPGTNDYFEVSPAVPVPGNDDEIACFFDMRTSQTIREFRKEIDEAAGVEKTIVGNISARDALMNYRDNLAAKQYAPFEGAWTNRVKATGKNVNTTGKTTEAVVPVRTTAKNAESVKRASENIQMAASKTASSATAAVSPAGAAVKAAEASAKTFEALKPEKGIAP